VIVEYAASYMRLTR